MRELRLTKIENRIYLFPVPVIKERKYLIYCSSDQEAQMIAAGVAQGKLTHPDLLSEDFLHLTLHTDKQTKIFVPSPKALAALVSS
jgi:hypothetical protein